MTRWFRETTYMYIRAIRLLSFFWNNPKRILALWSTYLPSRRTFSSVFCLFGSVRRSARALDLRDDLNIYNARSLTLPSRASMNY